MTLLHTPFTDARHPKPLSQLAACALRHVGHITAEYGETSDGMITTIIHVSHPSSPCPCPLPCPLPLGLFDYRYANTRPPRRIHHAITRHPMPLQSLPRAKPRPAKTHTIVVTCSFILRHARFPVPPSERSLPTRRYMYRTHAKRRQHPLTKATRESDQTKALWPTTNKGLGLGHPSRRRIKSTSDDT